MTTRTPEEGWESLSPLRRQVAMLVSEGLSNRVIGNQIGGTEKDVKTHVMAIRRALSAPNRTQVATMVWCILNPEPA